MENKMANTKKIKLQYPVYRKNRLKNFVRNPGFADIIEGMIMTQNDKFNNCFISALHADILNPGAWTLTFEGKDFWFEGPTDNNSLSYDLFEAYESKV